jgi:hypothetical protein
MVVFSISERGQLEKEMAMNWMIESLGFLQYKVAISLAAKE